MKRLKQLLAEQMVVMDKLFVLEAQLGHACSCHSFFDGQVPVTAPGTVILMFRKEWLRARQGSDGRGPQRIPRGGGRPPVRPRARAAAKGGVLVMG